MQLDADSYACLGQQNFSGTPLDLARLFESHEMIALLVSYGGCTLKGVTERITDALRATDTKVRREHNARKEVAKLLSIGE